jgi:hypothetical protein
MSWESNPRAQVRSLIADTLLPRRLMLRVGLNRKEARMRKKLKCWQWLWGMRWELWRHWRWDRPYEWQTKWDWGSWVRKETNSTNFPYSTTSTTHFLSHVRSKIMKLIHNITFLCRHVSQCMVILHWEWHMLVHFSAFWKNGECYKLLQWKIWCTTENSRSHLNSQNSTKFSYCAEKAILTHA